MKYCQVPETKVKGHSDLGARIIDKNGLPLNFNDHALPFREEILVHGGLNMASNEFQEFGLIDKDRARTVIETYSLTSGQSKARCLPSEFHHIKHAR